MVISMLLGGLGNQMFQYALGRQLSILNRCPLKVDTSVLLDHRSGRHVVNRAFDINGFQIAAESASSREVKRYNPVALGVPGKLAFRLRQKLYGSAVTQETSHAFDARILGLRGDIYLAGVWQSFKYFDSIESTIRSDFELVEELPTEARTFGEKLRDEDTVAVHVRRTDYVDHRSSGAFSVLGVDYYQRALEHLRERYEALTIVVFTDDPSWCYRHFEGLGSKVLFAEQEFSGGRPFHYLYLMSLCRRFVIANSTFSWWGAWLGAQEGKIVIAPADWAHLRGFSLDDLLPREWVRIP